MTDIKERSFLMRYIIMDFEWNNSYSKRKKRFINEIIEIGAVKLDDNLNILDTYGVLIKTLANHKLTSVIHNLTNIKNEDLEGCPSFAAAMNGFKKWLDAENGGETVYMTWSNTDIRVLVENYKFFVSKDAALFLTKFVDLQKYCQKMMGVPLSNQMALSAAAEKLGVDISEYSAHRALDDSLISSLCLKKCFDKAALEQAAMVCDDDFYKRLAFKSKHITDINSPKIDKEKMKCACGICGANMKRCSDWKNANHAFRALFYCKNCDNLLLFSIRFKECFDRIDIKTFTKKIDRKEQGHEPSAEPEI